jgi:hypothetical protein
MKRTPHPIAHNSLMTVYYKEMLFISAISLSHTHTHTHTHWTLRTVLYGEIVQVAEASTVQILARSVGECPVCFVNCLNAFSLFGIDEFDIQRTVHRDIFSQ